MPDWPGGSSAEPTLYQTICVTTGARWSSITTPVSPFGSVKLGDAASGAAAGSAAGEKRGDAEGAQEKSARHIA